MNNDWRNSDTAYGYRASQGGYESQQGGDYSRYSARHAASEQTPYAGYSAGSSSYTQNSRYEANDYARPSYGGGYSQNQNTSAYSGYGYAQSPRQERSAYDSAGGYRAQAEVRRTPAHQAPAHSRDTYAQGSYGAYSAPSYGQGSYQPTYSRPAQPAYQQPTYTRPSYTPPAYQGMQSAPTYRQPAAQPYGQGAYQQPTYQEPSYGSRTYGATYQPPVQEPVRQAGYASYYAAENESQQQEDLLNAELNAAAPEQEETAAPRRESRPVAAEQKSGQIANTTRRPASRPVDGQQESLSDDMNSRLERMRQAGEAALRAQGYQQEDATAFMNTGMINLDAVIGSMEEGGVDPVISAQQTARMAVIRQAQKDAPLQQPTTPAQRAQNSRPGYSANKEEGTHEEQRKRSIWKSIIEWVVLLAFAIGAAFLLRAYVVSFYLVQGTSMEPTFYTGQRLLVNKIGYTIGDIERFDTVVCHYPNSDNYYVKRVIGLPGDVVSIDAGQVYVNGQALDEEYVVNKDQTGMQEMTVAEGMYLVFGDNRVDSLDSRSIGAIEEDAIVGRVIAVTWPIRDFEGVKRIEDNVPAAGTYVPENSAVEDENAGIGTTDINPEENTEEAVGADVPTDDMSVTDESTPATPQ